MTRFLVFAFVLVGLFARQVAAVPGAGCDTTRRAVAHHSDGSPADPSGAPFPCGVKTGYGGAESRVAVAPNGDVLQVPAIVPLGPLGQPLPGGELGVAPTPETVFANNSGIGWSRNAGASWQLIMPNGLLYPEGDFDLYIDRVTGRLFYSCIAAPFPEPGQGFNAFYVPRGCLLTTAALPGGGYSPNWRRTDMPGYLSENPRFTSGPSPAGQPQPVPGENMAYWCANLTNLPQNNKTCHRSSDGGLTWELASFINRNPAPHAHAVCTGATSESAGYPVADADGVLWMTLSCGNNYLMKSTDRASTWQVVGPLPPPSGGGGLLGGGAQLRVDSDGNFYLYETNGTARLLRTSTDGGQTWSGPFNMTAPAARDVGNFYSGVAVSGYQPGHAAAAYMVARPDGGRDAYISVTHNALDPNPIFYSARINPSHQPIATVFLGPPDDFVTLDISPDGTPWAAFMSGCYRDQRGDWIEPYCRATDGTRVKPTLTGALGGYVERDNAKVMTMGSLQW